MFFMPYFGVKGRVNQSTFAKKITPPCATGVIETSAQDSMKLWASVWAKKNIPTVVYKY